MTTKRIDPKSGAGRRGLQALLAAVWRYSGPKLPGALALLVTAALLEGVGVVLLLPVVELIFAGGSGSRSGLTGSVQALFAGIGITGVTGQLLVIGAGFVLLLGVRAAVLTRRDVLLSRLSHGFVDQIRGDLFALLARADWPVIKRFGRSRLLDTMTADVARLTLVMQALSRGAITAALTVAYLAAAFIVSVALGLLLLLLVALGLVSAIFWSRRSHFMGERLTRANRGVMEEATRFLEGLKAAKVSRAEAQLTLRFADAIAETRAIQIAFVRQQAWLRNVSQVFAAAAALAILLLGYGLFGLGGGELLVMAAVVLRLAPTLSASFGGMQSLAHALPAFTAIRELEAELANSNAVDQVTDDEPVPASSAGPVPLVLHDCDVDAVDDNGVAVTLLRVAGRIEVQPGTLVHVSGPSGAGKSTMVELVAGLHLPARGSVLRGDYPLTAATRRDWQARISFAPQEPFLFHGSVRDNLLWPNVVADDAAIWRALEQAEAVGLVRELPSQLDEPLLDGGARLSGGERQRLCLARALLRPSAILILDEATSAMDPALERKVTRALKANLGDRIVLMVRHSGDGREHADLGIMVEAGEARVAPLAAGRSLAVD